MIRPETVIKNLYKKSASISDVQLPKNISGQLNVICKNIENNKAVYTVLITLSVYKILNPKQDIRNHKIEINDGFSGRSFDTKYITPTLKSLGLPSMAESGWLTRSIEQPVPFTKEFTGKIRGAGVKDAFLEIVDFVQKSKKEQIESVLRVLLHCGIKIKEANKINIKPIEMESDFFISDVMCILENHFNLSYKSSGASKLPVIAIFSIYKLLIQNNNRYKGKELKNLGSHTASDKTSSTSGDIEIFDKQNLFETVEIKFNRVIDKHLLNNITSKIYQHNPKRYYVLSNLDISKKDVVEINKIIQNVREKHGCQIIVNGIYNTLYYYLRVVDINEFLNIYVEYVCSDSELKIEHKDALIDIFKKCGVSLK